MRLGFVLLLFTGLALFGQTQPELPVVHTTVVITAKPIEPSVDRRDSEIFDKTLFGRDDQVFHLLGAGINVGQHEGGGKSLEVRRFGFNLDHGGVNGGLKVLVDNIQQNQTTQGHGQGYLGALKSLSPELVNEVDIVNGPFSPEYGDFSGLGVVHIRLRESMADKLTARFQAGSFNTKRGFLAVSPQFKNAEGFLSYEGSFSDGPFVNPLGYRRDNITGNYTRRLSERTRVGFRMNGGWNTFTSSGQLPLDEIQAGRLDRFGYLDGTQGGDVWSGTVAAYLHRDLSNGSWIKADTFVGRSLFDLYSNFTYFLNDPENGDGIQQHDSRLQQGANLQYVRPNRVLGLQGLFTAGANFHANQINVGLFPRIGRFAIGTTTHANAYVTNGAGYAQQSVSLLSGKLQLMGGLRFDEFRFDVRDRLDPSLSGAQNGGRWQPKAALAFTPSAKLPLTIHANYGRGISTADARVVVQRPESTRIATTDFFQVGTSHRMGRVSASTDLFLIDRSNELVYLADDGTFEFNGPSRAYGFETKLSFDLTRRIAVNAGLTKVGNVFYRERPRLYVTNAPRFVANAGIIVSNWKGWSGSLRMRAINHYRLDGEDPSILAAGNTVWDFGVARRMRRGIDLNFTLDNLTNRDYYETQNYYESRIPGQDPRYRIHATPGYPLTAMVGITARFGGK